MTKKKINLKNKINFVGIGAGQCATTWIHECLKEHPELFLLPKDEKDYSIFSKDQHTQSELKKYRQKLKKAKQNQKIGEFNITYYFRDKEIAQKIKDHNPKIKLIASLRDPIQRAYSNYNHSKSLGDKDWDSFEDAIHSKSGKHLIEVGLYYKHLKKFFDIFPREDILIMIYEDINKEPRKFIQTIYNFLEVDSTFLPDKVDIKVGSGKFKKTRLGKFVHRKITPFLRKNKLGRHFYDSSYIRKMFYSFTDFYVNNHNADNKTGSGYEINRKTKNYLKEYYKEDINKLEQLVNKDLSHWKNYEQ